MKSTEIMVNVGVTKNMGNYESLRLDYQMKVVLGPEDKPGPSIDSARDYLFDKMKKDLVASDGGKDYLRK